MPFHSKLSSSLYCLFSEWRTSQCRWSSCFNPLDAWFFTYRDLHTSFFWQLIGMWTKLHSTLSIDMMSLRILGLAELKHAQGWRFVWFFFIQPHNTPWAIQSCSVQSLRLGNSNYVIKIKQTYIWMIKINEAKSCINCVKMTAKSSTFRWWNPDQI